ncbi:MAG: DUF3078 domain-containing protein [Bacteroidales bacterium]|jgi:hypothetical protein|nr:DUF3078 domain-containing protein [Bacteroidales bacterium]
MRRIWLQLIVSVATLTVCINVHGQASADTSSTALETVDSLKKAVLIYSPFRDTPDIKLTAGQAVEFLKKYSRPRLWRNVNDPLRQAIEQLVFLASYPPFDSSETFLKNYKYDSIKIPWERFYVWDTLQFNVPVVGPAADSADFDINTTAETDSANVFTQRRYDVFPENTGADTLMLVMKDTLTEAVSLSPNFPFRYYSSPFQADSLETAVSSLIKYLEERDSTVINFSGRGEAVVPVWFNSKSNSMMRYWLKNEFNDSLTVWIGNTGRDTIGLFAEQGVDFRRPMRPGTGNAEARVNVERQDRSRLLELQKIELRKQLWKYRTETNLAFSQTGLFNWVKGGENSLSSLLDVTGYADFNNDLKKLSSNNFARLKLGFLATGDNPIRKNTDILETNTKVNHKAFGKFDFSVIMLFKTQLLTGYDYPNDSVAVSKILNPAMLTLGLGLDYKPNAQTSINFSPFAYKLTFVTDTAHIDQTKYGIADNRKTLHESGLSFMISNVWQPIPKISLTNRLQLFSNYVHNPQNIDVDWEFTLAASLNWFTELRINTHLIFDDDIKTTVLDSNKQPVLNTDGTERKTARVQFKEMVGISLAFKF